MSDDSVVLNANDVLTPKVDNSGEKASTELKSKAVSSVMPNRQQEKPAQAPVAEQHEYLEEEDDSASSDGTETPERRKPKKSVQKRFGELTRQREEARSTAERLAMENDQLRKQIESGRKPEATAPSVPQGKPKLDDYDWDVERFTEATIKWNRDQERLQESESKAKTERDKVINAFNKRASEFADQHDDYEDMISDLKLNQVMLDAAVESEVGPAVLYYLAENPEEADAIRDMSPVRAIKAMARLEDKLDTKPTPKREPPKKTTNAPPPPKTVQGSSARIAKDVDAPDITSAERIRLWREQRRR
jgi:hypothetical protein